MLYGAKEVELFDISSRAWDYFILKYYGIMIFSYEEFYDYFVVKKLADLKYFKRLVPYLPMEVANRLCELYNKYNGLSRFLFADVSNISFGSGKIIPYFNQDNYYRLQSILLGRDLPTFYLSDLAKLPWQLFDKSYHIILTSNIFYSLYLENEKRHIQEYK